MAKFRKRPVVIEAFQWTGGPDQLEDPVWIVEAIRAGEVRFDKGISGRGGGVLPTLKIRTLEGVLSAQQGDWIIRGTAGEIYPCKPEIFETIYEPVGDLKPVRYTSGECDVEGDSDGAAVFDLLDDGQPFCVIPPDVCVAGKEGALARAKDIALAFNKSEGRSSHPPVLAAKPESSDSQGGVE